MRISVLGSSRAQGPHAPVDLGGPKQRALLAALALHHGRAVSAETLIDLLWAGHPPAGAPGTLQTYVAGLRRVLEPDRAARQAAAVLVTEPPGYALRTGPDDLDAVLFERVVNEAHREVAPLAEALCQARPVPATTTDPRELSDRLDNALELWQGTPYVDLGDVPSAEAERARLEELRLVAAEDRAALALVLGAHATVAAELEALTRTHPLRERLWALRALALARSGRQADALAVLSEVRTTLDEELGLEPGAELRGLQTAILRQEAGHAEPAPPPSPAGPPAAVPLAVAPLAASPWPLVGRDDELAALTGLLDDAAAGRTGGRPAFAALTGEPGIGKSRLSAELSVRAAAAGALVVTGRCSQDDGAPALWPWATVLESLGAALPLAEDDDDAAAQFRAWDTIVRTVLDAAGRRPLLVVLDDLHWADTSSLRVLRLLAEGVDRADEPVRPRLLVVATWREHPAPTGPLAEVAEAFARQHALRIQLRGLTTLDAGRVVAAVADTAPSDDEADALRRRTDGNPFFLVEFARLARERGDLTGLLGEAHPPVAVQEVLTRRLARLDDDAQEMLRGASVLGRIFEVGTLAATCAAAEDTVLDTLEPALDAGLVTEDGVDRFRFTHALVRDTVLAAMPQSRRARVHARAAGALDGRRGHEAETARHWVAAGPRYVGPARLACRAAAEAALRVHAHDEAAALLQQALTAQGSDPESDDRDRFELLARLADVYRRSGDWVHLRETTHEALSVAGRVDDTDLLVRAGVMTSTGALWASPQHGDVDAVLVPALRDLLDRLPPGDDPRRCRVMLGLANEIYYGAQPAEREALALEAVAMARRLDDPHLLLWSLQTAFIAIWRPATTETRHGLIVEAERLAGELGDDVALADALTLHAAVLSELGRPHEMAVELARAREQAQRVRNLYCDLVLDCLEVPWLAMRGEEGEVIRMIEHLLVLGKATVIPQFEEAYAGALMMQLVWQGRYDEMLVGLLALEATTFLPMATTMTAMYCRAGRVAEARAYQATHLDAQAFSMASDSWFSAMAWSMAAETAIHLGDATLAAAAYERLLGLAGRISSGGSGAAIGPVDMFLAMAAATTGERDLARRHADRAEELCEQWRVPLAAQWVRDERDRFGL
jgi:DNA-binding SARP family transcriptional activator